jgi:hypothetical protein
MLVPSKKPFLYRLHHKTLKNRETCSNTQKTKTGKFTCHSKAEILDHPNNLNKIHVPSHMQGAQAFKIEPFCSQMKLGEVSPLLPF